MEKLNYSQIYKKFTKGLSPKTKDIFDRRFGVGFAESETLESIGQRLGITRERVRQIEEAGFTFIRKRHQPELDKMYAQFTQYFAEKGGFKREDVALEELGGKKNKPYVLFLLTIGKQHFSRVCGKKDYHYFWTTFQAPENQVKDSLQALVSDIARHGRLLEPEELSGQLAQKHAMSEASLVSYMEISKRIQKNREGKIGLVEWPEIRPRGVKDKAFLVFKKMQKPLHFRKLAELIDEMEYNQGERKTHPQTVHNELIKDQRFVLVGRGTYALSEWGYVPGTIKDIIAKVLKENEGLSQEEIVKEVLAQRLVAKNTVLINLNNKKYFNKGTDGKYFIRETQLA